MEVNMELDIDAIFKQKLAEINSRLASAVPGLGNNNTDASDTSGIPFEKYLSDASLLGLDNSLGDLNGDSVSSQLDLSRLNDLTSDNSMDKLGNNKTLNLLKARMALAKSTAYIPKDNTELMNLINSDIDSASARYGVDKDLIRAVMKQESGFNPTSISSSGAQGLMQLMPDTANGLGVKNPFDITQNINGSTQYLKYQLDKFNGNLSLALASYNAGPNSVEKYNGIPPYAETQDYVQKVTEYYNQYKQLQR